MLILKDIFFVIVERLNCNRCALQSFWIKSWNALK